MYRVKTVDVNRFVVNHYVPHDPNPTHTQDSLRVWTGRIDAWRAAFGQAAKQSLMLDKPQVVVTDDGRQFVVRAHEATGDERVTTPWTDEEAR